ncbi:MAG: signal peptide peptidase SppA [Rickettsiales bacterium]|nr:signal peptide peptidase SppA [Rickettsiales bacterium]
MNTPKLSGFFDNEFFRRKLILWRSVSVVLLISLIAISFNFDNIKAPQSDYIARVAIKGFIGNDQYRLNKLNQLYNDENLKALIIDIDSPGGSVVGGELLFNKLKQFSSKVPTIVFVGSQATSAAYLAAIGANHIVAPQGSIIGSIGVVMQAANIQDLAKSLGIKPIVIKSSPLKAIPHFAEDLTPEAIESLKVLIDDIYKMFVNIVTANRNIEDSNLQEVISGKVFTGNKALELGLIDQVGDFASVKTYLLENDIEENTKIKEVKLKKDDVSNLFQILSPLFKLWQDNNNVFSIF